MRNFAQLHDPRVRAPAQFCAAACLPPSSCWMTFAWLFFGTWKLSSCVGGFLSQCVYVGELVLRVTRRWQHRSQVASLVRICPLTPTFSSTTWPGLLATSRMTNLMVTSLTRTTPSAAKTKMMEGVRPLRASTAPPPFVAPLVLVAASLHPTTVSVYYKYYYNNKFHTCTQ